jgi:hypothetical protein
MMSGDRTTRWLRWIARGLGTLSSAWWLFIGIAEAIFGREPWPLEGAMLSVLAGANAVGVAIAWWRERIGGTVLVIAGTALCAFAYVTAGHNKGFAVLVSGGPFLVTGILFLASGWRSGVLQNSA